MCVIGQDGTSLRQGGLSALTRPTVWYNCPFLPEAAVIVLKLDTAYEKTTEKTKLGATVQCANIQAI